MPATVVNFDLETYSECDLRECGAYRYAMDPSTRVLCAAWNNGHWLPGDPSPIFPTGAIIEGYNVPGFDAVLWYYILTPRHGWAWPGWEAFRCTMARAAYTNLPGSLDQAAQAMGTEPKDIEGHRLMLQMCKPARAILSSSDPTRHHTPDRLQRLLGYCQQDVRAEAALSARLPQLPPREMVVFATDAAVNRRGVHCDMPLVDSMLTCAEGLAAHYRERLSEITHGDVESETSISATIRWCRGQGVAIPDGKGAFDKEAVEGYLADTTLPPPVREVMEIRQAMGKSSIAKLRRIKAAVCPDQRLRGMLMYYGAHQTGRWSGRIIQPQNLPRATIKDFGMGVEINGKIVVRTMDYQHVKGMIAEGPEAFMFYFGENVLDVMTCMLRPCMDAAPGNELVVADYNAIECRVLAWIAGEQALLDVFRQGKCPYKVMASIVCGVPYEQVTYDQRQLGKVIILACGYGMGHVKFRDTAMRVYGVEFTPERAKELVDLYRATNARIKALWYAVDDAAKAAIRTPGIVQQVGMLALAMDGVDLKMRLPSGRTLWYRRAFLAPKNVPWSTTPMMAVHFHGEDMFGRFGVQDTYGGKLVENACQAISRDVTADALVRAETRGLHPVLTVHDELACEMPVGTLSPHALESLLCAPERWSATLPLKAEGFCSPFYRK